MNTISPYLPSTETLLAGTALAGVSALTGSPLATGLLAGFTVHALDFNAGFETDDNETYTTANMLDLPSRPAQRNILLAAAAIITAGKAIGVWGVMRAAEQIFDFVGISATKALCLSVISFGLTHDRDEGQGILNSIAQKVNTSASGILGY